MPSEQPIFGAFSQGVDLGALIDAMQEYIASFVAPVWDTPAKLVKNSGF